MLVFERDAEPTRAEHPRVSFWKNAIHDLFSWTM